MMKKYKKGGSMPKEGVTGGPSTVPMTPERREFLKELEKRNKDARVSANAEGKKATPYAKGGMTMKKASKAGNAMKKRSADTMGRAMMAKGGKCYAKGGSIDGIAKKGKTRGKMC